MEDFSKKFYLTPSQVKTRIMNVKKSNKQNRERLAKGMGIDL